MFRGPEGMTPVRKWNLTMVFGIIILLFAKEITGHVVAVGQWIDWAISGFGVGLLGGALYQYFQSKKR